MAQPPTGTVTFLFTDIEGSTRLWEQYPQTMALALERHDSILRQAIEHHGGYIFKTIGDAFCAAFATAPYALAAALAAQQALQQEPWDDTGPIRVRMALHSGTAQQRDGDYFGPTLNRISRLLAVAHGGQILLSQAALHLVRDALAPGVRLHDHGERRLKDLAQAEHIYQIVAPGLPAEFPPLRSLESFAHNLPVQLTSFIGRSSEISEVRQRLPQTRLLTLLGMGGNGKTRLSLQVGAELVDQFQHGVWFVELAPLSEPALVPQAIASAMGLREEQGRPLIDTLVEHLRSQQALLILDNCEHLIAACAQAAQALLRACPQLKILATSREVLGVPGEHIYPVRPLGLPTQRAPRSAEELAHYDAVRLFLERAEAVRPGFTLTDQNSAAIYEICRRLDGIPLALELAAARVRLLQVEQIAARLDQRFRLLTSGSRTLLPRQQTLQALIDWSHDLLPEPERVLFRRLAVFAGGWTLEAAEAVCAGQGVEDYAILELLGSLVDKSLVMPLEQAGGTRYRLLETIREYARHKLPPEEEQWLSRRHLDYFAGLVGQTAQMLYGVELPRALEILSLEHDNVRAALEWSLKQDAPGEPGDDLELGAECVWNLHWFWYLRGHLHEGREWCRRFLARGDATGQLRLRAMALYSLGGLSMFAGELAVARQLLEQSLLLWQQVGEPFGLGLTWFTLGITASNQGDAATALESLEQSLALFTALKHPFFITQARMHLGDVALEYGDYQKARASYQACVAQYAEAQLHWTTAQSINNLGEVARCEGDYAQAQAYYEQGLALFRQVGGPGDIARSLHNLGHAALAGGAYARAVALFGESLALYQRESNRRGISECLAGLAALASQQGHPRVAMQLLAVAEQHFEALGAAMWPADRIDYQRSLDRLQGMLEPAELAQAQQQGRALTLEQGIALARETLPLAQATLSEA